MDHLDVHNMFPQIDVFVLYLVPVLLQQNSSLENDSKC